MSISRVRELIEQGNALFARKMPLHTLWQSMAEQFYPERADFTVQRSLGNEFASHLMTGAPALAGRDLANSLTYMLRPPGQTWFHARTQSERINEDSSARAWLDRQSDVMRNIMADRASKFDRATKEGDRDFATFGQAVITVDLNDTADGILYRCWHLRDVAWTESTDLEIDTVHRNWKYAVRSLVKKFPKTVSPKVRDLLTREPNKEINCRHIFVPSDEYDLVVKNKARFPFVSIVLDCDNETILEEVPARRINYVIPRWQTVSGSQYAHSPATVIALPDARMLQQINLTLLEAGQKFVDPPLVGVGEMIVGGVNSFAGGVTWVDAEYDERLGEVLRPLSQDRGGLNWGTEREQTIHMLIKEAFFLNQLTLPEIGPQMTAYEVQKRIEEYIRRAMPLFAPMETEYNAALCDITFDLAMENGAFGSLMDIPQALRGAQIRFQFQSPLKAASERAHAEAFTASSQLLQLAATMSNPNFDTDKALRDALEGAGAPADWIVPEEQAQQARQALEQQAALHQAASAVGGLGQVAEQAGTGAQALQQAGML